MKRFFTSLILCLLLTSALMSAYGQNQDRFQLIEQQLKDLSAEVPGLNEKVNLSLANASIQEFLRGLAEANSLNINIDPQLNFKVYNNFKNERAGNILLFLAREYNLDIRFIGSIISIFPYLVPVQKPAYVPKNINVSYDPSTDQLLLVLTNDSLQTVAKKITEVSGKNVIATSNTSGKTVTVFINASFQTAIEQLAYSNNLKFTKTADGVFLLQLLPENEENYISSDNRVATRKVNRNSLQTINSANPNGGGNGQVIVEVVKSPTGHKLINVEAKNASINDVIRTAAEESEVNYYQFSDIKGTVSTRLKNVDFDQALTTILLGTDYTYKIEKGICMIGERKLEGLRALKVIQLQNRSIDTIVTMLPAEWKKGVEIKEFREQNTLLLAGSQPQILELEAFIKQLDKLVPMVLIEVTMIDIRKGKNVSTGIKVGIADSVKAGGTLFPGLDYTFGANSINKFIDKVGLNNTFNIGKVPPNFYVKLSALEQNSNVDVRSMPKLATLNGHTANLSIGSTRYYSTSTQNVIGSLNPQTVVTQVYTPVSASLGINIKPIVSGDEQVTLNIKVDISDFLGDTPINVPPSFSTSKFESIIRVRNEEMVVLGGLERTEKRDSGSGVPLLSRIPVLKWFFSSREKGTNKVVSVVFIKPTIIYK